MNTEFPKILIAEDELSLRTILKKLFSQKNFQVETAGDGELALSKLLRGEFDLALLDIKMPGLSGLEILEELQKEKSTTSVIVMTAQDTMHNAVQAMKWGAYDYIHKPFELEELEMIVDKALEARRLSREVQELKKEIRQKHDREAKIVGSTRAIREIYKTIGKVANRDVAILITGESGTGKELIAKAIHQHSQRSEGPFVAVNCAAIPKELIESELFGYRKGAFTGADENRLGYFEMANRGTLFLDEIGDLPLVLQGKLLRVLQEKEIQRLGSSEAKPIDVRILAATNQDLEKMVKEKKFREDLFFRLNVIPIHLPPLRERKEDIPLLCEYFLSKFSEELGGAPKHLSDEVLGLLEKNAWPGNIRELENILKRAVILSNHDTLRVEDFSFFLKKAQVFAEKDIEATGLEELVEIKLDSFITQLSDLEIEDLFEKVLELVERPLIRRVLEKTDYNQLRAAEMLGINRNTLRKKILKLKISKRQLL